MPRDYSTVGHWRGGFDEAALQQWAEGLRNQLSAPRISLGLVFMAPPFFPHAAQVLEILRVHAQIPLLAGCSSTGLINGAEEVEEDAGLVLGLFHLPGAELRACRFVQDQVEESNGPGYWHLETGLNPDQVNGWLVFADPFHLDCDTWLKGWNEAYSPAPILGGLASGEPSEQRTQVYINGDVHEDGGVAIAFGGEVGLASVISQGCTPIGETWTITRAERNLIHEIGNRPAYEVLLETFNGLPATDQKTARGNLFVGLVINEYLEEFHRGDFLIRNLLGADPNSGCIAIGAFPRTGQTIQFQRRDSSAASEDLSVLLENARKRLSAGAIYGGCLCCCNGRGARLFGRTSHDASTIQQQLGPFSLAGFFCNGEIGPVGDRSFLHGYTASLALFLKK
ncbi:MAG: FIST C-terminal domain-containing protein [Verrucomicrobia bacterium]|nr:FIST C-terminal domain-containing protein [Verrucomicrobiota bacterium]